MFRFIYPVLIPTWGRSDKMSSLFLAKSNQTTLQQHTADVLETVTVLQDIYGSSYPDEWWVALKYSALLHDLGKIHPDFQDKIKRRRTIRTLPHSLFSLFFIRPEHFPFDNDKHLIRQIIISAVAFHHWREYFPEILLGGQAYEISEQAEKCRRDSYFWDERVTRLYDELSEVSQHFDLNPEVIGANEVLIEYLSYHSLGNAGLLVPPYTLSFLPARLREKSIQQDETEKLHVFLSGNLMRADHFASLVEDNPGTFNVSDVEINRFPDYTNLVDVLKTKFDTQYLWQAGFFDDGNQLRGQDLILVAPTGVGKTEFAYLWGAGKKNMVVLPMRAAVNGIWNRTRELWGDIPQCSDKDVALLHGDASLELYQRTDMDLEGEIRPAMDMARQLSQPYIVCTADQIAPAALRYPGYERIFATLMNTCLVIDEVQAYDPRASAIIAHLIKQNNHFGGKTLLMTATLPAFIRDAVCKGMGISSDGKQFVRLLEHSQFKDRAQAAHHRIALKSHFGDYLEFIDEMLSAAREGQKVLVVVNTIKTAVNIYRKITEKLVEKDNFDLVLLHSRFTNQHRQEKTEEVYNLMANKKERSERPCIVISTQIVEASLDLDADILFTDAAPADSLIQRMGRVYRRYAQQSGDNAPEEPNVVIMVNTSHAKNDKEDKNDKLAPGVGPIYSVDSRAVYDLDLTLLSLLLLIAIGYQDITHHDSTSVEELFTHTEWKEFFKEKPLSDAEQTKRFKTLEGLLAAKNTSFVINEVTKITWVELCYQILLDASSNKFPLFMGSYVHIFNDTIDLLDHGYCTDRKRDAEKLFRNVRSITAVPIRMKEEFFRSIQEWHEKYHTGISYLNLAAEVLHKHTVSVPIWHLEKLAQRMDLTDLLDDLELESKKREKVERWLQGLFWIDLNYSYEFGLIEGD